MEKLIIITVSVIVTFGITLISGTILYFIWDDCIPYVFNTEILPKDITWWQAITLTWVFNILIKNTSTKNKKD